MAYAPTHALGIYRASVRFAPLFWHGICVAPVVAYPLLYCLACLRSHAPSVSQSIAAPRFGWPCGHLLYGRCRTATRKVATRLSSRLTRYALLRLMLLPRCVNHRRTIENSGNKHQRRQQQKPKHRARAAEADNSRAAVGAATASRRSADAPLCSALSVHPLD